jgi:hypothetical protein
MCIFSTTSPISPGHLRMGNPGAFHLGRSHTVARNIDDVIDTPSDLIITILISVGAVTSPIEVRTDPYFP